MMEPTGDLAERILILRTQAGDREAFEQIVCWFGPRLQYYLLKMLGNAQATEDAFQEVWFDVYRNISKLREPAAFRPWIYRIARDRASRTLRKAGHRFESIDEVNHDVAETDERQFTEDDARQIHAALDKLSIEHREVLVLRFIEDLSYEEIAEVTGKTVGTVKSRIHYAKRFLRQEVKGWDDHV